MTKTIGSCRTRLAALSITLSVHGDIGALIPVQNDRPDNRVEDVVIVLSWGTTDCNHSDRFM